MGSVARKASVMSPAGAEPEGSGHTWMSGEEQARPGEAPKL